MKGVLLVSLLISLIAFVKPALSTRDSSTGATTMVLATA